MRIHIYPTDREWFDFLAMLPGIDEVNFWRPGGQAAFTTLRTGDLFLFRLKSPVNKIAGGGVFTHFSIFPLNAAWDAFGIKNGTSDFLRFTAAIASFKGFKPAESMPLDSPIGCIILSSPFFLPPSEWISVPDDYPINNPQGGGYDATSVVGRDILEQITHRLQRRIEVHENAPTSVLGDPTLVRRRLGQGAFRVLVTDLYGRRCAVTGERTLPVLEAAHILPVSKGGIHRPDNGLLLRSDIHKLFDLGYVTISEQGQFRVSSRLRSEWQNGRVYYNLTERAVAFPKDPSHRPNREWLQRHNDEVFRG